MIILPLRRAAACYDKRSFTYSDFCIRRRHATLLPDCSFREAEAGRLQRHTTVAENKSNAIQEARLAQWSRARRGATRILKLWSRKNKWRHLSNDHENNPVALRWQQAHACEFYDFLVFFRVGIDFKAMWWPSKLSTSIYHDRKLLIAINNVYVWNNRLCVGLKYEIGVIRLCQMQQTHSHARDVQTDRRTDRHEQ